jgi:hypothetical protein
MNNWLCLRGALKKARGAYRKLDPVLEAKSEPLLDFLLKIKKGSKKIRTILDFESINQSDPVDLRIVDSFATITNTTVPDVTVLKNALGLWNKFYFTNDFREFLFKQRNNTLGLGARVAHFDENVDERCTFCRLLYPAVRTREDFLHLFRNCPITLGILRNLTWLWRLPITVPGPDQDLFFDKLYWYGIENDESKIVLLIFFDLIRYVLWKFKTRRTLPRIIEFASILSSMLDMVLTLKPKIRTLFFNNHLIANVLQALG